MGFRARLTADRTLMDDYLEVVLPTLHDHRPVEASRYYTHHPFDFIARLVPWTRREEQF